MEKFDYTRAENYWCDLWDRKNSFTQHSTSTKENYYVLEMLPYPSGKLHMGHVRNYTIGDVIARYKTMNNYNVLHPMGWDSFGLPAENAAINHGSHPAKWTFANIENMKRQLKSLGFSYDWDREIATCTPEYYKWNQWLFIKMYEKGLVYKKTSSVNWCPHDQTVLANEQVENGCCWRCSTPVIQKDLEQWFLNITHYSEELLADLTQLEAGWPEKVIAMQKNWIGKSTGTQVDFKLAHSGETLSVFTTRPDTLFGATYMVIAPEHPLVAKVLEAHPELSDAILAMRNEDKFQRSNDNAEKIGVDTSLTVINPINNEAIPLWIANYVLMDYGTGAVMAVPAHDTRDFAFAKKYHLPIRSVIKNSEASDAALLEEAYTGDGLLIDSGEFSGQNNRDSIEKITEFFVKNQCGTATTHYKLRDWLVSRQRYWGTPIPMIYCDSCGMVPENLDNLPVKLPGDIEFTPNGNPLESSESFKQCTCPKCGKAARRETDTMDTFYDSSWYYFRYITPKEDTAMFGPVANDWIPVNQYIGGVEHAVLHLLYARFFTKVIRDMGLISHSEPFKNLLTQGMVLSNSYYCEDDKLYVNLADLNADKTCPKCGKPLLEKMEKMSKSKNNGVDPERIVQEFGADAARLFTLFAAPPEKELEWNENGLAGAYRFLNKLWLFVQEFQDSYLHVEAIDANALSPSGVELLKNLHKTIKKVTYSIENNFHFNTAIASIMEFLNSVNALKASLETEEDSKLIHYIIQNLVTLLNPFVPFITAEIYKNLGYDTDLHSCAWPSYDEALTKDSVVTIAVQVNGKLRGELEISIDDSDDFIKERALALDKVLKHTEGKTVVKILVIKKRIVNIVVK